MKVYGQKSFCVACFLLFFLSQTLWAGGQDREKQFNEGVQAYSRGEYKAASQKFQVLARDGLSAALLFNLANSYAQIGESGRAILNYERARRLASADSDIKGNLELIRKEKGLFQEEQSLGRRVITFFELNQWTGMAAIAFFLFATVLLLPLPSRLKRTPRYVSATMCLLFTVVAITGAVGQYHHWNDGVVIIQDARLRVSPFDSAASIGTIQEGRLVRPGKSHGSYFLVEDETGRRGWLEGDAFESIVVVEQ